MTRFVPLSDELIYDHPEWIPADGSAVLVPFHLDLPRAPLSPPGESGDGALGRSRLPPRRDEGNET